MPYIDYILQVDLPDGSKKGDIYKEMEAAHFYANHSRDSLVAWPMDAVENNPDFFLSEHQSNINAAVNLLLDHGYSLTKMGVSVSRSRN